MSRFDDLFADHVATSLEKQCRLLALVGDADNWHLDTELGLIQFQGGSTLSSIGVEFPLQVLGSESEVSNTWLWSWANTESQLPEWLTHASQILRRFGETEGIAEFITPTFDLSVLGEGGAHRLALVSSGLLRADAYYRAPYERGAVFVLLRSEELEVPANRDPLSLAALFLDVIEQFQVDHRRALTSYLTANGYTIESTPAGLVGQSSQGRLAAEFDANGRLARLSAE